MGKFIKVRASLLIVTSLSMISCTGTGFKKEQYQAEITRTTYGVPHISADSFSNLGYGLGYAFAEDNYCVLADKILSVRAERARFLGENQEYIDSDFFYSILNLKQRAKVFEEKLSTDTRDLMRGYSAGINKYRRTAGDTMQCDVASFIKDITTTDLLAYQMSLAMEKGSMQFQKQLLEAQLQETLPQEEQQAAIQVPFINAQTKLPNFRPLTLGSNAWAIGDNGIKSNPSLLMANPHFPWTGAKRFYMAHLTIPEKFDVMGASIFGIPAIQIGFNHQIGWTHTVSTSTSFLVYSLQLHPDSKTKYKIGETYLDMDARDIEIKVSREDGQLKTIKRTYYSTKYGPLISDSSLGMGWTGKAAFALSDTNFNNALLTEQWLNINKADSVEDLKASLKDTQGIPWVNTIAIDKAGKVFYGDTARVPRLTAEQLNQCWAFPGADGIFNQSGAAVVKGGVANCDVISEGVGAQFFDFNQAPQLTGVDHVSNSNNSHWAPHLTERLEGFSPLYGQERAPLNLRARLSFIMLEDLLAKRSALGLKDLEDKLFNNRIYSAEILFDSFQQVCLEEVKNKDIVAACQALSKWDKKANLDSEGVFFFREFMMALKARSGNNFFSDAFNPNDPINTPRKLTLDKTMVAEAIVEGYNYLKEKNVDPMARIEQGQFFTRGKENIPIPGDYGQIGAFNTVDGDVRVGEGYQVGYGTSFVMFLSMTDNEIKARGILAYSQSTREGSAHFADQTQAYSKMETYEFPFSKNAIEKNRIRQYRVSEGGNALQ